MSSTIEKVTLSLDRPLLETMARKANKSMSEYVRDLIEHQQKISETELIISDEIREMRGSLSGDTDSTKKKLHKSVIAKLRNYDRA